MENIKDNNNDKDLVKQLATKILQNYKEKYKDKIVKVSNVATPPTPTERAEEMHSKVRSTYMKKLLPSLEKD